MRNLKFHSIYIGMSLLLFGVGCTPHFFSIGRGQSKNVSVAFSADESLQNVEFLASPASSYSGAGAVGVGTGLYPGDTPGGVTGDLGIAVTDGTQVSVDASSSTSDVGTSAYTDANQNGPIQFSFDLSGFSKSLPSLCSFLAPFNGVCNTQGFQIMRRDLITGTIHPQFKSIDQTEVAEIAGLDSEKWTIEQVTDLNSGSPDGILNMASAGDRLFFYAQNSMGATKLFALQSDDTVVQVSNTRNDQSASDVQSGDIALSASEQYLYFVSSNPLGKNKLYRLSLSNLSVLTQVTNTSNDQNVSDFSTQVVDLSNANGSLYFSARNSLSSTKLYLFNEGSSTLSVVSDTAGGAATDDFPLVLGEMDGVMYFWSVNSNGAYKLYQYDGSVSQITDTVNDPTIEDVTLE